jgi:hypothetical protein
LDSETEFIVLNKWTMTGSQIQLMCGNRTDTEFEIEIGSCWIVNCHFESRLLRTRLKLGLIFTFGTKCFLKKNWTYNCTSCSNEVSNQNQDLSKTFNKISEQKALHTSKQLPSNSLVSMLVTHYGDYQKFQYAR